MTQSSQLTRVPARQPGRQRALSSDSQLGHVDTPVTAGGGGTRGSDLLGCTFRTRRLPQNVPARGLLSGLLFQSDPQRGSCPHEDVCLGVKHLGENLSGAWVTCKFLLWGLQWVKRMGPVCVYPYR